MRREIASTQLFGAVRTEGLAPTSRCATTSSRWRARSGSPRRSTSPTPSSPTCPSPRAEQLNAYFEANKTKFQIPEFRAFSYVLLTVDDVMPQVTVTPEQVKQEYDARTAEFGTPEKRDVDQAMADSEDKAKADHRSRQGRQVAGGRRQGSARQQPTA